VSVGQRAGGPKDTFRNLRSTGELVVNVVSEELAEAMNASSVESGPELDEFDFAGLAKAPSLVVRPPRVAAALAHLEARLEQVVPLSDDDGTVRTHVLFARVVHVHVDDALVTPPHRVDVARLAPLARLAGTEYGVLRELFSLPRPTLPAPEDAGAHRG
jgi:flavin reductase (DIM6/NTAB) family NADH-FMN oxidoreductase RutF